MFENMSLQSRASDPGQWDAIRKWVPACKRTLATTLSQPKYQQPREQYSLFLFFSHHNTVPAQQQLSCLLYELYKWFWNHNASLFAVSNGDNTKILELFGYRYRCWATVYTMKKTSYEKGTIVRNVVFCILVNICWWYF